MALNPATDVAARLAGTRTLNTPPGGTVDLVLASNLFSGPMREADPADTSVPACAVFCSNNGGAPAMGYMSVATHGSLKRGFVEVEVRGSTDQFTQGEALAQACLRRLEFADLTGSGYVSCLALSSQPNYVGQDPRGLHLWTFLVELTWREAAYTL
jgi:hypothetical protein